MNKRELELYSHKQLVEFGLIAIRNLELVDERISYADGVVRQLQADGKISMREMIMMLKPIMWINFAIPDQGWDLNMPDKEININESAFENLTRKLNEANSRIVEFENIKAGHLQIQKEMQEQIDKLKGELDEVRNKAD